MYGNGSQNYRRTNVTTADPKKLVLMCYEGAIDNLKIGKQKILEEEYEGKGKALSKAQDIINELLSCLDFEKGGSIATGLDSLYNYMLRRIIQAGIENDTKVIDEVIGILNELKSAWEEAFSKPVKPVKEIQPEAIAFEEEKSQLQAPTYSPYSRL